MSLYSRIASLDDGTRSSAQIAALVGCKSSYVRASRARRLRARSRPPRRRKCKSVTPWIKRQAAAFLAWRQEQQRQQQ